MNHILHSRVVKLSTTALISVFVAGAADAQSGAPSSQPSTSAISGAEQEATPATAPGAVPVQAQDDPERVTLGDIVVTARKRAVGEELQSTPISATAVGGAELQQANAVNLVDVGKLSPGVSFQNTSTKSGANFSIRGVGVSGSTPSDEPAVGIFQDGIYWGSNTGALGEMFDMESVEILRGPQGTLFGRNVSGGAIVLHTARPSFTPSASISAGYGYRNTIDGSVILTGPVIGDTVAARLAVSARTTDGYFNHVPSGTPFGKDTVLLIRPTLLFKPTEALQLILRGEYYSQAGDPVAVRGEAPGRFRGANQNTIPVQDGFRTDPDYYDINTGDRGYNDVDVYLGSAELNWEVGPGVFTWINGFRQVESRTQTDFDGFPVTAWVTTSQQVQHQVSSELRYAADIGDRVSFTAGGFFFHQAFQYYDTRLLDRGLTRLSQKADLRSNDSYAAYAEADFKFTDRLVLTLGGRYTVDKKEAQIAPYGACTYQTFAVCTPGRIGTSDNKKFTPKVGVSFQATPTNLVYASYTQGIRSGGYALRGSALLSRPFLPEIVTAYEIGTKNDFFDHRLRLNVSVYQYDYNDIQRTVQLADPVIGFTTSTFNAAKAKVKGVDLGINAQITNELRLDVAYGYVDAKYQSFVNVANPGGLKFVRIPDNTLTVAGTYTLRLADDAGITARASGSYTGPYFYDDANLMRQKGYTLVDASLQYTFAGGNTSVSAWGKNLTQAHYASWGSDGGARFVNYFLGNPRTYGVRVSHNF